MKVSGTSRLNADREAVWRALNDPAVLVRSIPGCQRLEALGEDAFAMTLAAGVGAIKGVYDGQVQLRDREGPGSFRMTAHGSGAPGTIHADVLVLLGEDGSGGTALSYEADATVGGMIGGVGQRMLTGVSRKMAEEFFRNVDLVLAGGTTPPPLAVEEALAVAGAAGPDAGPEAVPFRAPSPTPGTVFTAPSAAAAPLGGRDFARGVVVGAAAALLGAVVGGWLAGRRRR
jgi:carbon monoxide dehydrogenase subunit G